MSWMCPLLLPWERVTSGGVTLAWAHWRWSWHPAEHLKLGGNSLVGNILPAGCVSSTPCAWDPSAKEACEKGNLSAHGSFSILQSQEVLLFRPL